jgi:microcystin-dependent protein
MIGEIRMFAGNFAPRGWAFCQGQILSIAQNTALFSILGTTYGGNGQTTFALPDLRGRAAVGQGQGPGLSPYYLGQKAGMENTTLLASQLPAHTHVLNAVEAGGNQASPAGALPAVESTGTSLNYSTAGPSTSLNPNAVGVAGGSQPFSIMQPYLAVNYIIALEGIFPARN